MMILCYGRLYRTVSYLPATVICGWLPMKYSITIRAMMVSIEKSVTLHSENLLLKWPMEKKDNEALMEDLRTQSIKEWQKEWDTCQKGQWTKKLIKKMREHNAEVSFWMAQALSGHGVFAEYLYRMKRRETPMCSCGDGEETAEHVFTECRLFPGRPNSPLDVNSSEARLYMVETVKSMWQKEHDANKRTRAS